MAALTIATWLWGTKYGEADVAKLAAGVRRHLQQDHRFIVISDRPVTIQGVENYEIPQQDRYLLSIPGCFARLRMFDPAWQEQVQVRGRLANIDLDTVITGHLDPLFNRAENFVILQGANAQNPCPYNGSIFMLRAGVHADVWSGYSLKSVRALPFHEFPDDQGWLAATIPNAAAWKAGSLSGVYAFKKPGWPAGDDLPADARMVVFPGWRSPSKFTHLPWVKKCWRM